MTTSIAIHMPAEGHGYDSIKNLWSNTWNYFSQLKKDIVEDTQTMGRSIDNTFENIKWSIRTRGMDASTHPCVARGMSFAYVHEDEQELKRRVIGQLLSTLETRTERNAFLYGVERIVSQANRGYTFTPGQLMNLESRYKW